MTGSQSKAGAQSLLVPHSYHYRKASSSANFSSQGYKVASQRLCSTSRSMEQLIMGDDIKEIIDSADFQAAFAGQFDLSPILDEPNSPESESDEKSLFLPRQRSQSLKPYAGSSQMQRSIETTSSIGYNLQSPVEQTQSPYWKAPPEKRLSKEDYSAWIRFENPIDLLSPVSTYKSGPEQDQGPLEAYSMTREETQSYLGDSAIEATFSMHARSDLGSSSQKFGGLFLPSLNGNPISPSLQVPKAENHHGSNHKSLRKKISQSLKDAFGKPAHNA